MRLKIFGAIKTSFSVRIYLIVSFFILAMSASFIVFFVRTENSGLREQLVDKGYLMSGLLAHNARIGVFAESESLVKDHLKGVLLQDEIAGVYAFTADGRLLSGEEKPSKKSVILAADTSTGIENMSAIVKSNNGPFYFEGPGSITFYAPVITESSYAPEETLLFNASEPMKKESVSGFTKIIIDKTFFHKQIKKILVRTTAIGVIFLLLGTVVAWFVLKKIIHPLNKLTDAVETIGSEGSAEAVTVDTSDEIGRLATAFNAMIDSLKRRAAENQQLEMQLRHSQKMEAVGQLAGGVAHDFNNILTAIIGYSTVLQMKMGEGDPLRRTVERILAASERAAELTRSLLAFSRKQVISLKPMDINRAILNVEKLLKRLIPEDIELRVTLTDKNPVMMGDAGQLEQVLMNLTTNAKDAMPDGGLLTIETQTADLDSSFVSLYGYGKPGKYAVIAVSDTGAGMDEETRKRIFEPFFTTKEVGKGTGLGLSIVYGIVKQHNGYINVYSEPGSGTVFKIYMPVDSSDIKESPVSRASQPAGGTETLLLAEDDKEVRDMNCAMLEGAGYKVITAADGGDTLNRFNENRDAVNLLILDVMMPKMNGREVYERAMKIKPDLKVLFTSGYPAEILGKNGVLDEGLNFIAKPTAPTALMAKIREMLDK